MLTIADPASIAATQLLRHHTGHHAGPSTGTNLVGALRLACEMRQQHTPGSIVTLLCDNGTRYTTTYNNPQWLTKQGLDPDHHYDKLEDALMTGQWSES